jgi:Flp pilus assembly CpaF family ATPase
MRALLHECHPSERIMVLEQEPELQLDADHARHNQVLSWIARPANVEGQGAVTLADLAWAIKRHNPDRIVVGEVLGDEVMVMLEAAGQGIAGAICTMHAKSSYRVFSRMVHYAQLGLPSITPAFVMDTAADALDLVVYLDATPDGRRVVSEITYVREYDPQAQHVVADQWYIPGADRAAVRNPTSPMPAPLVDELVDHGYVPSLGAPW